MKYSIITSFIFSIFLISCSDDDENPTPINEEEVITTVQLTLVDDNDDEIILRYVDTDGDGPNEPFATASGNLRSNTDYAGTVAFLNETTDPPENITEEVEEEAEEHQVIYTFSTNLNASFEYQNFDGDGNALGTEITIVTGQASAGNLTITLRHEPNKPNDGSLDEAGGETDVQAVIPVMIED